MLMPSGPGAPRLARTFFQASSMLASSTTASINDSGNKLKAGCSADAVTVRPGRDTEPVVSSGEEGLPRDKSTDDSSLFFIVRPFLSRLDFEAQYYGLC